MTGNTTPLEEICDMLIDGAMFSHLPADELREVAPYFGINNFIKGKTIFKEGDEGSFMGIVHEGRVSIIKTDQSGNEVVMGVEGPGRVFGEMAVLDGERRSATCEAATDCVLLTLAKKDMDAMLDAHPRTGAKILRAIAVSLSRRMRMTAGKLVDYEGESQN